LLSNQGRRYAIAVFDKKNQNEIVAARLEVH
jgi:hypothetical protein